MLVYAWKRTDLHIPVWSCLRCLQLSAAVCGAERVAAGLPGARGGAPGAGEGSKTLSFYKENMFFPAPLPSARGPEAVGPALGGRIEDEASRFDE